MEKEKIYKQDVLNLHLEVHVSNAHDMQIVRETHKAIMDAVKAMPAVEDKTATRRKRA